MTDLAAIIGAPFFIRATLGGLAAAALTATLGAHVVIRRDSLFGDAIAHSALAGVALGLLLNWDPLLTTLVAAIICGAVLPDLERRSRLPLDNWLGALLPTTMSLGIVLLSLRPGYQPDLISYLFGNLLAISQTRLIWLLALSGLTGLLLYRFRHQLLLISFDRTLAQVAGIRLRSLERLFSVLLAVAVTAGIQVVGAVLINTLLVVPAATVRLWANNTRQLFVWTPLLSAVLVVVGLLLSAALNLPSGPLIAVLGGAVMLVSSVLRPK